MFHFIDIYSFIHMSGCVGMGPSALLCPGAYDAVTRALVIWEDLLTCRKHLHDCHFYWSDCTKPGKWAVIYLRFRDIDLWFSTIFLFNIFSTLQVTEKVVSHEGLFPLLSNVVSILIPHFFVRLIGEWSVEYIWTLAWPYTGCHWILVYRRNKKN